MATICESVEYVVGAETAIRDRPGTDIMRPACGLGFVVGMEAEFVVESEEVSGTHVLKINERASKAC